MEFPLRLPDYYKGDISINQFIVNAVAEKIASLRTAEYLEQRAKNADIEQALNLLKNAPDREPLEFDR